ncbi:TATA element modulatory factor like [Actinidia chinensis var. chinensis]|uniref:TATA element modulatory factor like n=1 Tax=Actinidia chinensis var. chinensis TaxID=1590841 RepID=A0A2R6QH66_ACTCC|nr:TATA element modulatory factor like [Actinidia chinensis var. chinensis]
MSSRSSSGSSNFSDIEELVEIGTRCQLRKEKDMLRGSQSQSFELIRRLELHVKTISEARADNEKRIQELERELKNCSEEIDYLQDQLNARNEVVCCLSEHVHSLELKVTDMDSLEEKVGRLTEELNWSNVERLILIKELENKDVELQNSASCIEKLEESVSSVALEYQCEIESMRLDLMALKQSSLEAKKFQDEAAQEKARMNELIQDLELQIQNARKNSESLNKENNELREKLDASEINTRIFCQKIEEQFEGWLENKNGPQLNTESSSRVLETDISTCGNILGPLLSRLAVVGATDADFKDIMSRQIRGYEVLVKQLKEEVKTEKLKAKEEAEDLAQEMAELRYQITDLLEEERKRRACIEQISLQRISELEAQIKKDRRESFSSVSLIHEA